MAVLRPRVRALSSAPLGFLSRSSEGCQEAEDGPSEADARRGRRCRCSLGTCPGRDREVERSRPGLTQSGGGRSQPGGPRGVATLAVMQAQHSWPSWDRPQKQRCGGCPGGDRQSREGTQGREWTGVWSCSDRLHLIWVLPRPFKLGRNLSSQLFFQEILVIYQRRCVMIKRV